MIAIELHFPTGKLHATPWGRQVISCSGPAAPVIFKLPVAKGVNGRALLYSTNFGQRFLRTG